MPAEAWRGDIAICPGGFAGAGTMAEQACRMAVGSADRPRTMAFTVTLAAAP